MRLDSSAACIHGESRPHGERPALLPLVHFAVEVDDWDAMLANLDQLGLAYGKTVGPGRDGAFRESRGGDDPRQGRREYDGSHYTYLQEPDGNVIELVHRAQVVPRCWRNHRASTAVKSMKAAVRRNRS